jgi:hypothetical protein
MFIVCWWYTLTVASDLRQRVKSSASELIWPAPGPDLDV